MWSPAIVVIAPEQEPVSLSAAKEFLRIDADLSSFDIEIGAAIAGARGEVEDLTGTRLMRQTVDVVGNDWIDLQRLPIGPVLDLVSLQWQDDDTDLTIIDLATIELTGGGLARGIRPKSGFFWPYEGDRAFQAKRALDRHLTITARLTIGYGVTSADLPGSIYAALLLAMRGIFDDKSVDIAPRLASHGIWRP